MRLDCIRAALLAIALAAVALLVPARPTTAARLPNVVGSWTGYLVFDADGSQAVVLVYIESQNRGKFSGRITDVDGTLSAPFSGKVTKTRRVTGRIVFNQPGAVFVVNLVGKLDRSWQVLNGAFVMTVNNQSFTGRITLTRGQ